MWTVRELKVEPHLFRFGGIGEHRDFSLIADGELLVNLLDCADWSGNAMQALLCADCGRQGCAAGNWVAPRALPDGIVFAPVGAAYVGERRAEGQEAPVWMFDQGAPVISRALWSSARAANPWLPELADLPALSWQEALLIAQFEVPGGCLGYPGESSSKPLPLDPPLPPDDLDRLFRFQTWSRPAGTKLLLRPAAETQLHSAAGHPIFGKSRTAFGLYLRPDLVAFPDPGLPKLTVVGQ